MADELPKPVPQTEPPRPSAPLGPAEWQEFLKRLAEKKSEGKKE